MQFCSVAQFLPLCGNRKTIAFMKFPGMRHAGEGTAVFSIVGLCKSYISSFAYSISPIVLLHPNSTKGTACVSNANFSTFSSAKGLRKTVSI